MGPLFHGTRGQTHSGGGQRGVHTHAVKPFPRKQAARSQHGLRIFSAEKPLFQRKAHEAVRFRHGIFAAGGCPHLPARLPERAQIRQVKTAQVL